MDSNDGIFSLRLVIADFYMEKPIPGLDPVYSEFRGKEIKKVPIIRVFGSNAQGQKTCMHIHGVFPYFYIPYDQKDFDSVNKAIYQIAINLDKAINISLSQGSSNAQHVFKVQLVKGIPFYGYHRSEHQYLKIYMFNPRFVRRAANLLQNGAIMNKNFHPHEAHVPYVLQFMIDYNLYGMSFIHLPLEIVKFRRTDNDSNVPYKGLRVNQILSIEMAKKVSCSTLECDIGSNFILNRFQLASKPTNKTHSNPGIESIWNDEKLRRQKMAKSLENDEEKLKVIPALEVPSTQERPNIYPTESEVFYRTALLSKLLAMENSMLDNTQLSEQTINCTLQSNVTNSSNITLNVSVGKQQKRTFNLPKILQNSVYPEECSQKENLINASFVTNHLSNNNLFQQSLSLDLSSLGSHGNPKISEDESIFLEDTIIDEDLVLSLTQSQKAQHVPHNATLRDEDMELLDILQQLEEDNNSENIDLDSSLAPLTQNHEKLILSPELLVKETTNNAMEKKLSKSMSEEEEKENEEDSDDENIHDFSVALENLDTLILKLTQTAEDNSTIPSLPQVDGSDDLQKTPTKSTSKPYGGTNTKTPPRTPTTPKQRRRTLAGSPSRSPRTPKSGHKYKPLPLIITNRSTGQKTITNPPSNPRTPCKEDTVEPEQCTNLSNVCLRKKLAISELRRKSISLESKDKDINIPPIDDLTNTTKRRSRRIIDLDKTHVTCNLTPRRTNEKLLKVYNVETNGNALEEDANTFLNKAKSPEKTMPGASSKSQNSIDVNFISKTKAVVEDTTNIVPQYANELEEGSFSTRNEQFDVMANEGDNEEIIDSGEEVQYPSFHARKTPNLKRLRRSVLSTHSAKRRKITSPKEGIINSSKFLNTSVNSKLIQNKEEDLKKSSKSIERTTPASNFEAGPTKNEFQLYEGTERNLYLAKQSDEIITTEIALAEMDTHIPLDCPDYSHIQMKNRNMQKTKECRQDKKQNKILGSKKINKNETQEKLDVIPSRKCLRSAKSSTTNQSKKDLCQNVSNKELQRKEIIEKSDYSLASVEFLEKETIEESIENCGKYMKNAETMTAQRKRVQPKTEDANAHITVDVEIPNKNTTLKRCYIRLNRISIDRKISKVPIEENQVERNKYVKYDETAKNTRSSEALVHEYKKQNESFESMEMLRIESDDSLESEEHSPKIIAARQDNENLPVSTIINLAQGLSTVQDNENLPVSTIINLAQGLSTVSEDQQSSIALEKQNLQNPTSSSCSDNMLKALVKLSSLDFGACNTNTKQNAVKHLKPSDSLHSPSLDFIVESPFTHSSEDDIAETPTPPFDVINKESRLVRLGKKSINSPLLFTQNSSPSSVVQNKDLRISRDESIFTISSNETAASTSPPKDAKIVLTPMDLPPTRDEVLKGCLKLKIPEYNFQQPYYSNPDDVTKHKEIGFTILQINSNKINDLEEFQSVLGSNIKGITAWRRQQLAQMGGPEMLVKYRNSQRIREYFATQKKMVIAPQMNPPTRLDAKVWLKARELLKIKANQDNLEEDTSRFNQEDSPIKIRRQKVTMMLNADNESGGSGGGGDSDNSLDCSSMSLTLTPLTPGTPIQDTLKEKINGSFTPVTTKLEKIPLERIHSLRKRNNRRVLRRVSLNQKMREALEKDRCSQNQENSQGKEVNSQKTEEHIISHSSQNSETSVSSETALAEMERSSFMRIMASGANDSTLNNSFGFKVALENLQEAKADIEFNYLTIITLEVFVATREDLFPNPQIDEIRCLFYAIENSIPNDHMDNDRKLPRRACGYIMVNDPRDIHTKEGNIHGLDTDIQATIVQSEVEALETLLGLCSRWDPDIYAGYEIEMSSWGFVIDRAKYLCLNIAPLLSRVPSQKTRDFIDEDRDQFTDLDIEMKLCGRILLDVWRLMRSEIALTSYTFENVMYHILHKRCPCHSYRQLTEWYFSPGSRWIVLEYFLERVRGTLALLDQLDLIGRTSEMAKLIGIQFYEVLSRGSQFRVESMMLRIAKPRNLVPVSPSVQQRAHMRAPEYLPLILEPQSRFYADPLIVLDFQSLYPSMIIGYNYCFSTCLGRVEHLGQSTPFEFGASQLRVSPTMLRKLVDRDLITISPCGVVFVKSSVREGILPRMLTEILDTRQMVKQSMKLHKSNSALQRILHSRQLGLKLMANVTYGYTAANFSGRMPAVEVGDSVVAKGRETLERAIKTVEANEKWNVKVVYGDTDSLFVLVPGRNREEAFRIGEEIAETITKANPHPVKLKLEKVYQPCILQTKKRYVGYMYETADQAEPVYEAKGIETVRRDGCPMVAKMLEKVLRILFETADVSQVKQYVCRQFTKLLSGRANLQDLIFAKEFRGMNGYKANACVPALELTRKWIQTDPRRIPRRGERVPFIITNGPPGVPLIRLIRHPHEVLADEGLKINAIYYITKAIIPPLNRCLLLIGADVNEWFANLPRKVLMTPALSMASEVVTSTSSSKSKKSTISQFFSTTNCIVDCGRHTKLGICEACNENANRSMIVLQTKISKIERGFLTTQHICQACCGRVGDLNCNSLDCPVLYVLEVKRRDLQQIVHYRKLLEERF